VRTERLILHHHVLIGLHRSVEGCHGAPSGAAAGGHQRGICGICARSAARAAELIEARPAHPEPLLDVGHGVLSAVSGPKGEGNLQLMRNIAEQLIHLFAAWPFCDAAVERAQPLLRAQRAARPGHGGVQGGGPGWPGLKAASFRSCRQHGGNYGYVPIGRICTPACAAAQRAAARPACGGAAETQQPAV
jgi:hypothetical protein